jgi:hypothetical protein
MACLCESCAKPATVLLRICSTKCERSQRGLARNRHETTRLTANGSPIRDYPKRAHPLIPWENPHENCSMSAEGHPAALPFEHEPAALDW